MNNINIAPSATTLDLQHAMEAYDRDIQKSFDLSALTVAIASHRASSGLEAHEDDLLMRVADYAIQDTDVSMEDMLAATEGWKDVLGSVVGAPKKGRELLSGALKAGYDTVIKLIGKFFDWIESVTNQFAKAKAEIDDLYSKIDSDMSGNDWSKLKARMTSKMQNILQIDHKVISDVPTIIKEYDKLARFVNTTIYNYANELFALGEKVNKLLENVDPNVSPADKVKELNRAVLTFINKSKSIVPNNYPDDREASDTFIGGGKMTRSGVTGDLRTMLNSGQIATVELAQVRISWASTNSNNVVIDGDHRVEIMSKAECVSILKAATVAIEDILNYNSVTKKNLEEQLNELSKGSDSLSKLEQEIDGKKFKIDGKSDLQSVSTLREMYRYQTVIWRWGTLPITGVVSEYMRVTSAVLALVNTSFATDQQKTKEAENAKS